MILAFHNCDQAPLRDGEIPGQALLDAADGVVGDLYRDSAEIKLV
jgi:hypothetical protein